MNCNDTPALGLLTEADLDAAELRRSVTEHRLLPAGCDQQGRFATRSFGQPEPAEAASEIGADQHRTAVSARRVSFYSAFLPAALALSAVGCFALIALAWKQ